MKPYKDCLIDYLSGKAWTKEFIEAETNHFLRTHPEYSGAPLPVLTHEKLMLISAHMADSNFSVLSATYYKQFCQAFPELVGGEQPEPEQPKVYTLDDLKEGRVAVINDGTVEQLREVLKYCFPEDKTFVYGDNSYYFKSCVNNKVWEVSDDAKIPTQSVKEFIKQIPAQPEQCTPQVGEMCEFSDNPQFKTVVKREFITMLNGFYMSWSVDKKRIISERYCRQINKPTTFTTSEAIEIIKSAKGISGEVVIKEDEA